jgi:cardiolipin synthase
MIPFLNKYASLMMEKRMIKLNIHFFRRLPAKEKKITFPTFLTITRIIATPIIVVMMLCHYWGIALMLFAGAAITDLLDGNIARWRGEQTVLGACLDPIADKILILSCLFALTFVQSPLFAIPVWFLAIVLLKELILVVGAIFIYAAIGHIKVQPMLLGKVTTCFQMVFIAWLFSCYFFAWLPIKTYYTMLGLMLILVIASFVQYTVMGIQWLYKD